MTSSPAISTSLSRPTPFGSGINTRGYSAGKYRFGFNGKEEDGETAADAYDFGARIYDARLGRWLAVDPFITSDPSQSAYKSFNNCPLLFIDPDGKKEFEVSIVIDEKTGRSVEIRKVKSNTIMTDGVRRTFTDIGGSEYQGYGYYDYETVTVRTIKADGSEVVTKQTKILYDRGVIDNDGAYGSSGPNKGQTKRDWDAIIFGEKNDQRRKEQPGGYYITTQEKKGGVAKTRYFTPLDDAEEIKLDELLSLTKYGKIQDISKWGEKLERIGDGIALALETIDKIVEDVKNRNPDPCTENLCTNTKCDRNDEAKVKNNPNIPHSPGPSHDIGGKVIEVECDKLKNK